MGNCRRAGPGTVRWARCPRPLATIGRPRWHDAHLAGRLQGHRGRRSCTRPRRPSRRAIVGGSISAHRASFECPRRDDRRIRHCNLAIAVGAVPFDVRIRARGCANLPTAPGYNGEDTATPSRGGDLIRDMAASDGAPPRVIGKKRKLILSSSPSRQIEDRSSSHLSLRLASWDLLRARIGLSGVIVGPLAVVLAAICFVLGARPSTSLRPLHRLLCHWLRLDDGARLDSTPRNTHRCPRVILLAESLDSLPQISSTIGDSNSADDSGPLRPSSPP